MMCHHKNIRIATLGKRGRTQNGMKVKFVSHLLCTLYIGPMAAILINWNILETVFSNLIIKTLRV